MPESRKITRFNLVGAKPEILDGENWAWDCQAEVFGEKAEEKLFSALKKIDGHCCSGDAVHFEYIRLGETLIVGDPLKGILKRKEQVTRKEKRFAKLCFSEDVFVYSFITGKGTCCFIRRQ